MAFATGATFKYIFLLRLLDPSMLDFDASKQTFRKSCFQGCFGLLPRVLSHILRNTESFKVVMKLPPGTHQLVQGLPGDVPPYRRSLWLTSDGYHRAFVALTCEFFGQEWQGSCFPSLEEGKV